MTTTTLPPPPLSDLVPHVFYINLLTRPDRKAHIIDQFKRVGITAYERFNAICLPSGNGRIGCTLSHLKCLELAKERQYKTVLICEDDTTFTKPALFMKQFRKFMNKHLPMATNGWDVVLLAGNNVPPYTTVDDTCIKVTHCQTTTCYLVAQHYYDTLINNIKTGLKLLMQEPTKHLFYAIDMYWLHLQKQDCWFLITPLTVVQREDYSDIEKRKTNYAALMTDIDKHGLMYRRTMVLPSVSKN